MKKYKTNFLKNLIYKNDRKAVSLMISYVILIAIAISISIAVFSWLRLVANVEPVANCEEGTSIIINEYNCGINLLELSIRNNGRFSVNGFLLTVGDNVDRAPITRLVPVNQNLANPEVEFIFETPLKPGETSPAQFTNKEKKSDESVEEVGFEFVKNLRIQPFIIKDNNRIFCTDAVIRQNLENCQIKLP